MRRPSFYVVLTAIAAVLAFAAITFSRRANRRVHLKNLATTLPADGRFHPIAAFTSSGSPLTVDEISVTGVQQASLSTQSVDHGVTIFYRFAGNPSTVHVKVSIRGQVFSLELSTLFDPSDSFSDGTPDFLRLHSAEDRQAFRHWFTELAERMADTPERQQPSEIQDCASLLRYSYREALRVHDDKWYAQFDAITMPALPSVHQWTYPNTPINTGLFRITPGPFTPADTSNGAFQSFADAKTLMSLNTFLLSRDIRVAKPGDLIFYRVLEQESQYHSMIITGNQSEWVVYHTGPIGKHRGEMRRVLLNDLLHHPNPKWHPVPDNPNFLGVYRWNILRED